MREPLGQHFLHDGKVIKTILASAELKKTDTALEIGPGKGAMTEGIAARVGKLVAIELDHKLARTLQHHLAARETITILQSDFLKVDLDTLFAGSPPVKVLGNLPYSITSPIFEKLMGWSGWNTGVFLTQREVAERIAAKPGSRTYGILTLAIQLFAEVEMILQVPPGAFAPPPKVFSSVIRLRRKEIPGLSAQKTGDFFHLLHAAFAHRRKTIANSLAFFTGLERDKIQAWLLQHKISPTARAETIALEEYAQLAGAWSIFRREMNLTSDSATSTIPRA